MSKGFGRIQKRRQRLETIKDALSDLNEMEPWEVFRNLIGSNGKHSMRNAKQPDAGQLRAYLEM